MANIQTFFDTQLRNIQANSYVQKVMQLPPLQRWLTLLGLFLAVQVLVFGSLYIVFGRIVVIGFFASVLAGLATGAGALPVLFLSKISDRLFNGLLGMAGRCDAGGNRLFPGYSRH